jgi:hypothetical protein
MYFTSSQIELPDQSLQLRAFNAIVAATTVATLNMMVEIL